MKTLFFLLLLPSLSFGADVRLAWTANTEPDLAGYRPYWGMTSGNYTSQAQVGLQTNYTVTGLTEGTWYFALSAFDTSGNESGKSIEIAVVIPPSPPPPPPGPVPTGGVTAYAFDDGSGSIAVDAWNGNPATLISGPIWGAGKYGGGIVFDGVNDFVSAVDNSTLDLGSTGTIEAWVKLDTLGRWHGVISKGTANSDSAHNYALEINAGNQVQCVIGTGSSSRVLVGPTLPANTFKHLACSWDGATFRQFIDGALTVSMSQAMTPVGNSAPLSIGQFGGNSDRLDGTVDEVRIFNVARTQAEIQSDMMTALAAVPPAPACSDGLDNDSDGLIDLSDPGCVDASDTDEFNAPPAVACNDGIDNDTDGLIDMNDPGCSVATDTDEFNEPLPPAPALSVSKTVSRCSFVLSAPPPDGLGGWTARFYRGGTTAVGNADSSAPFSRTVELTIGTYDFSVVFSKSGQTSVTYPTVNQSCP